MSNLGIALEIDRISSKYIESATKSFGIMPKAKIPKGYWKDFCICCGLSHKGDCDPALKDCE
jgi:hypothetical protein